MRDFMYVAETKDEWREWVLSNNIAHVETTPESMLLIVYNPGFSGDEIGPMIITPGVYDNTVFPPIEITPPVWDNRFHVNIRVIGDEIEESFIRLKTYRPKEEDGVKWLEPEQVTSPGRVWLGEMIYFSENIPDLKPVNTSPPVLSHLTAGIGNMVSIMTPGVWTGEPDNLFYQWMRDGAPINQAITPNHTVNVLDVNHTLTCEETARNSAGETSVLSNECVVT